MIEAAEGVCIICGNPTSVLIQGAGYCLDHVDDAFAAVAKVLSKAQEALTEEEEGGV